LLPQHLDEVKTIFEKGITIGNATFQIAAANWQECDNTHVKNCRIIATEN